MKRSTVLVSAAAAAGAAIASARTISDPLLKPGVHVKPGDVLVFQINGGAADLKAFAESIPPIEGVTYIFVNERVTAELLADHMKRIGREQAETS